MGPLISLIVPFYNVAEKVIPCLQSIFCQTYTNYEIVLIDDGSTDNSAKIVENAIKEHDRCYLISTTHRGVSHARNCGVEHSKGQYIAFIDADDIITSDYLEKLILPMCRDESIDICACGAKRMTATGEFDSLLDWKKEGYILPKEALEKLFAPASIENLWGKIHRREICLKYQSDERFSYGEDLLASWYFINLSRKLYYIPSSNYIYNVNSLGACQGMPILKRFFNILNVLKNIQLSQFFCRLTHQSKFHCIGNLLRNIR